MIFFLYLQTLALDMIPLIKLTGVSRNYTEGQHSGVSGIHLEINSGEILSIVGESGSGKTTLLKLIYGYLIPDEGEILYNNQKVLGPDEKLIAGHDEMRMVTQDVTLNMYAKVFDNISSQLSNTDLQEKNDLTLQTMDMLNISHLSGKKVVDLSGGEQQRVAIARAVITKPKVLLLDEPFSQIDTILKKQLRDDIERLSKQWNITIVMVSHDPADALSIADKLVVIKDGSIVRQGNPETVYLHPEKAYVARLLGKANILQDLSFLDDGKIYAVYPQDVHLGDEPENVEAVVKSVHFSGFYNEITFVIENQDITAYDFQGYNLKVGAKQKIGFRNMKSLS